MHMPERRAGSSCPPCRELGDRFTYSACGSTSSIYLLDLMSILQKKANASNRVDATSQGNVFVTFGTEKVG